MVCDDGREFEWQHKSRGGLARAARLVEAASGELIHESGSGTIWRIVLPGCGFRQSGWIAAGTRIAG